MTPILIKKILETLQRYPSAGPDTALVKPAETAGKGTVSVVIPLYNHEQYIEEALRSVLGQSLKPFEIIVIDDGSTDASATVVRKLCADHPEIVFWSHPNQGAHYTINAGIHRATGEFISILNSDDRYYPDRLVQCLEIFDSNHSLSAVCTGLAFMDENGSGIENPWYDQSKAFYHRINDLSLALINGNFFMTTSNLIVKRSVFQEIGLFSSLRYAHDLDFFLRLLIREKQIFFLDRQLLDYRLHRSNTILEGQQKVKVEWACVTAFFLYSLWDRRGDDSIDWGYFEKFIEIAERHTLTPLLLYFLTRFATTRATSIDGQVNEDDPKWREFIHRVAK